MMTPVCVKKCLFLRNLTGSWSFWSSGGMRSPPCKVSFDFSAATSHCTASRSPPTTRSSTCEHRVSFSSLCLKRLGSSGVFSIPRACRCSQSKSKKRATAFLCPGRHLLRDQYRVPESSDHQESFSTRIFSRWGTKRIASLMSKNASSHWRRREPHLVQGLQLRAPQSLSSPRALWSLQSQLPHPIVPARQGQLEEVDLQFDRHLHLHHQELSIQVRSTEEARTCEAWFHLTFRPQKWNLKAHMWYQLSPFPSSTVAICDAAPPRQHSPILRYSALLRYSVLCFNSITQCNWQDIETMAEKESLQYITLPHIFLSRFLLHPVLNLYY